MSTIKYIAAVGSDGTRPVVWGVGRHADAAVAAQDALIEAQSELREAGAVDDLRTVEIDDARWIRIIRGDVSASDL